MRQERDAGRYRARFAATAAEIAGAQALRHRAFFGRAGIDADRHDAICRHLLIEDGRDGRLVGCCRVLAMDASGLENSYSARFYDLSPLREFDAAMLEIGRFCVAPGLRDADILRVAWARLAAYVDENEFGMLFGCSSFPGTEADGHADAFAMLRDRHLGPARWSPRVKAPQVIRFSRRLPKAPDISRAMRGMPPLLKSYLKMGGWVSDHAVIDRDMGTLHVFTGVEVATIPAARKRFIRAAIS